MNKQVFLALSILTALILGPTAAAIEPDGRLAFRYEWPGTSKGAADGPTLRLSITAHADLTEARLSAAVPSRIGLTVETAGSAPAPWPDEGLKLGNLASGQTVVVELDVARPSKGGGIIGFLLQATASDGRLVREGVGVPVGVVGTEPTLRHGAVEFPAERPEPSP